MGCAPSLQLTASRPVRLRSCQSSAYAGTGRTTWGSMFAHRIAALTGPGDVQWTEVPEPAADGGVVIDVAAAGVSFADLLQTQGAYQMRVSLPYTPGMDAAGEIGRAHV